ncbi:MAG: 16S rRNA (cytosine(1402)-N(4))-methyltransferase RsmH [Candidatus Velthaea sp.]
MEHASVLPRESIEALAIAPAGVYVDATYGAGGHTALLLAALGPQGRVVAFDSDPGAQTRAHPDARLTLVHANFRDLAQTLDALEIAQIDGILYDLGVSSMQIDRPERGFSYREDAPLDMRMDPTRGESALELIETRDEGELADIIFEFGEDRAARRIARAIKAKQPQDTAELAALVAGVVHVRGKRERTHPATRTFQALRIAVNDELGALRVSLDAALDRTREDGRIAVISFHSLEDRIVKQTFRDDVRAVRVTRKPIVPGETELAENPRSRSAKLRVAAVTHTAGETQ